MASLSCIVGAGALGQAFAAHLAAAGHAVLLLGTPRSASALAEFGSIRLTGASQLQVAVTPPPARGGVVAITDDPLELVGGKGVLFTTKAHQLTAACDALRLLEPAWVAGVQNGLVKDDILANTFGPERVLGMATICSAGRKESGEVAVSSLGHSYVGELDGSSSERAASLAATLCAAGIPTDSAADIRSVTWSKACNAVGVFGVSVLTRTTAAEFFSDPDLLRAYLWLVRETAAIATAHGVAL